MNLRLRPYPAYKPSGVDWLGDVPAHWAMIKMKYLLDERVQKGFPDEPLLAATQTKGVVTKDQFENRTVLALKDFHLLKLVEQGDFVISLRSFQGGIEYAHQRGIISPAYTILRPTSRIAPHFYRHLFKSSPFIDQLSLYVTGIRQGQNIDYPSLARSALPFPPLDEQAAIVRFLDHMDAAIRRYIQAKRRLIALLTEQKQAIVHQAVTQGLDPAAPRKPSGVEWLDDFPAHWGIRRLKTLLREVERRSEFGEETHLSMSQKFGLIPSTDIEERRLLSQSYAGGKLVRAGELVLNRLKAHLGVFALAPQDGIVSPDYTVFASTSEIDMSYYLHVLRSPVLRTELRRRAKGIVQGFWRLYTNDFYDIRVPYPPIEEQKSIVEQIEQKTSLLSMVVDTAEKDISLIREYRTRLIADVVTGQLDVRGVALPEHEEEIDKYPGAESEGETVLGEDDLETPDGEQEET